MSSQDSAPATTAQMAMAMMSSRSWSLERSMRGSVNSVKCRAKDTSCSAAMVLLLVHEDREDNRKGGSFNTFRQSINRLSWCSHRGVDFECCGITGEPVFDPSSTD